MIATASHAVARVSQAGLADDATYGACESFFQNALAPADSAARLMTTTLHTPRLTLRPFRPDDLATAFTWLSDPEVMRFIGSGPDKSPEQAAARLRCYTMHQARYGFSKWIVLESDRETPIGDAGLMHLGDTNDIELGYRLVKSRWGKGLASELAQAWLARAFGPLGLTRVIAFARQENAASVRVMTKAGFLFLRNERMHGMDYVVYSAESGDRGNEMLSDYNKETGR